MYPLDDDNLDHLSREAAEHFEVEAGASGWDHLEQRLDKELPQEKKKRRFLFWLFLITATTGGALTAILTHQPATPLAKNSASPVTVEKTSSLPNNQTTGNHTINATKAEAVSGSNNKETPETTAPNADKLPVGSNQQSIAAATNTKPGSSLSKPEVNQPATASRVTALNKGVTKPAEKTTTTKGSKAGRVRIQKAPATLNYATTSPEDKQIVYPPELYPKRPVRVAGKKKSSTLVTNEPATAVSAQAYNTSPEPGNRVTNASPAATGQPVETKNEAATVQPTTATQADSLKNKTAATQAADSTKTMAKQKRKDDKIKQPLEFGVMVGPDMSAVAFGPLYKAGYNFGVQVGYRFSDRWSVNAGAIYTKKFYKTDSSHFSYKENAWPGNRTVSRVEGNCSMWEIPVNVRYDFSFNNKRRWFASTGLSTYLMDKEDYDVYYRWNGGAAYPVPVGTDSNSTYLFSIWNLSVGMERSLGKRFSLQAEPYLKVPLRDLGLGNMRMNSYGILFTLKYKPFLHSKRSDNNKK